MPPCVSVSWAGYCYHSCHFYREERDISCLGGTNFFLVNSMHLHNSQPCSHPHTADRFIIVCQESAGFTFQQNGPIWWANRCTPTPIHSYPCHHLSTYLNPACSYPILPADLPAHSGAAVFRLRIHVSVTSFVSDFISFYFILFIFLPEKWGKNGSFWQFESLCVHLKCFTG